MLVKGQPESIRLRGYTFRNECPEIKGNIGKRCHLTILTHTETKMRVMPSTTNLLSTPLPQAHISSYHYSMLNGIDYLTYCCRKKVAHSTEE